MGSLKTVLETARLATNAATQAAQDLYGTDVHEVRDDITTLETASVLASTPQITDSGAYYTGTSVEAALAEIGALRDRMFTSEVQTIVLSSWDATDTIKLTFNAHETSAVTYASDVSAEIQAALIALSDFDAGDLTVARTDVNTYVVTFKGNQAGKNVGAITVTNGTGSATGAVTQTVQGGRLKIAAGHTLYSTITADSANIQDDTLTATGLSVTVPEAGTYSLDAFIPYTTDAADDIQFKFGGTATVTADIGTSDIWIVQKPTGDITAGLAIPILLPTSWTTAISVLTTGAGTDAQPVIFQGKLVITAPGTIMIQFAQAATGAHNTHVSAGSWLKLTQVA